MTLGRAELEHLFNTYYPRIYNYVFYRLLDRSETETLLKILFARIATDLREYDPYKESIDTWLRALTNAELQKHYATSNRIYSQEGAHFAPRYTQADIEMHTMAIVSHTRRFVMRALFDMPERERIAVYHKYCEGMKSRALAQRLGINESTLSSMLMRSRRKLCSGLEAALTHQESAKLMEYNQ